MDCGVAYKKLKPYLYKVRYLLITHRHNDHLKITTYQRLRKEFPRIIVIANWDVAQVVNVDKVVNVGEYTVNDFTFTAFDCPHDVPCTGFVWSIDGERVIYATDTTSMKNAPDEKYDWFFIESNHDEKKLEQAMLSNKYKYDTFTSSKRHLSTKEARTFYFLNRNDRESHFIELHKSNRFY